MPALIRYPFFGCVALFLAACGSSGSSTLYNPNPSTGDGTVDEPTGIPASYPDVAYLIADIPAAIGKFVAEADPEADPEAEMPASTDARALTSTAAQLNDLRNSLVGSANRYLSTGANCTDASTTGPAKCVFAADDLRAETTFHLGAGGSMDETQVSFLDFMADRQPVMLYRDVLLSQVRTEVSKEAGPNVVYEDSERNTYILTPDNVTNMNLTDVALPTGVMTAPDFSDLFAVYEDANGNKYLLTPDNVTSMDLMDVALPTGVTTAPAFDDLSVVEESHSDEYVGYDGMLRYSMFFVGVQKFFDDEGMLQHTRIENASLGRIYDEDTLMDGIQSPSVALTGDGVMVGIESLKSDLEHHLVQGDVNIDYDPFVAEDTTNNISETLAMIDITITNIQRLVGEDDAWYASQPAEFLKWTGVVVENSEFEGDGMNPNLGVTSRQLHGSFYGVENDPEVGGVFQHSGPQYEIIGSFGSKLDPMSEDDPDMMDPMQ